MRISELIKNLEDFKEKYGDLECWYACDPEGNDHFPLEFTPTKAYIIEGEGVSYSDSKGEKICVIN
jgi:hypothetical protein